MDAHARPEVTVLLPAFNEARAIAGVIADIRRVLPHAELLVVDDGSADATAAEARQAGARVLSHPRNQGKGVALRTGFAAATGDLVLTFDADGQDAADDLPALVAAAREGADMVIGSRFLGTFEAGSISWPNYAGTRFFNALLHLRYGRRITDSQAGVRCFRRSLLQGLRWDAAEYEVETEMLIQAIRSGATIAEIGVRRRPRRAGSSAFSRVRHGLRILHPILLGRAP
jgi:glycosyltransferase involved in cell wall biosynthesis